MRNQNNFKNEFEEDVFLELRKLEPSVRAGIECGGVNIDLLLDTLVVECDGVEDNVKARFSNMKKQAILERCGFKVIQSYKARMGLE